MQAGMPARRVVVTGVGMITPLGIGAEQSWEAMLAGKCGIRRITLIDPTDYGCKIAGEVPDFEPALYMDRKDARRADRFIQMAVAGSRMALENSGLQITEANAERTGVLIGSGIGGLSVIEEQLRILFEKGPSRVSPFMVPMMIADMASGFVSIITGAKGPNSAVITACATGANAIGDAYQIIRRGDADAMICGGSEAAITRIGIAGFVAARAMSTSHNDDPEHSSRPFDAKRDGFIMGEGVGTVILEDIETAQARGANILAEIVGYGMTGDAFHFTQPHPEGDGAIRAMKIALKNACLPPESVDYINAHGTSTPYNDRLETFAIKAVFGEHANKLAISSTKSMTGHLLGAGGAVEAIACILAMRDSILPPTINYEFPDPDCDLDYVPNKARPGVVNVALSNSFGFGGHNVTLILKKFSA
jgi:3-oxoacyl-[acyl-carrier-protein] synthase II